MIRHTHSIMYTHACSKGSCYSGYSSYLKKIFDLTSIIIKHSSYKMPTKLLPSDMYIGHSWKLQTFSVALLTHLWGTSFVLSPILDDIYRDKVHEPLFSSTEMEPHSSRAPNMPCYTDHETQGTVVVLCLVWSEGSRGHYPQHTSQQSPAK